MLHRLDPCVIRSKTDLAEEPLRPGDRVRISAVREVGSARLLDGLLADILEAHPLESGWYKIRLDNNEITPHLDWSAPADRLRRYNDLDGTTQADTYSPFSGVNVKHFP